MCDTVLINGPQPCPGRNARSASVAHAFVDVRFVAYNKNPTSNIRARAPQDGTIGTPTASQRNQYVHAFTSRYDTYLCTEQEEDKGEECKQLQLAVGCGHADLLLAGPVGGLLPVGSQTLHDLGGEGEVQAQERIPAHQTNAPMGMGENPSERWRQPGSSTRDMDDAQRWMVLTDGIHTCTRANTFTLQTQACFVLENTLCSHEAHGMRPKRGPIHSGTLPHMHRLQKG